MTAWDISTAVFQNSKSVVNPSTHRPTGLFFRSDGLKMYVVNNSKIDDTNPVNTNQILEFNLSPAWDISTASLVQSFSVQPNTSNPEGVFFKPDGTRMFIVKGDTGSVRIHQYNLSTPWNISTASFFITSVDLSTLIVSEPAIAPTNIFFRSDGLKMYITDVDDDQIHEFNLTTAWSIANPSLSFVQTKSVIAQDTFPSGVFFRSDGLKMFVTGAQNQRVYEYNLSTAWNISTVVFFQSKNISAEDTFPQSVFFKPDGLKMFTTGGTNGRVYSYDLSGAPPLPPPCVFPCVFFDRIDTNTGWTIVNGGGQILIDDPSAPDVIKLNNITSGAGGRYAWKDIGTSISGGDVKLEFKLDYISNTGVSPELSVGIVDAVVHPQFPATHHVIRADILSSIEGYAVLSGFVNGIGGNRKTTSGAKNQHAVWIYPNNNSPVSDSSLKGPYYVTVELRSNKLRLSVFTDVNKTQHIRGSPRETDATGILPQNLRYIIVANSIFATGRVFNGTVDDIMIRQTDPLPIIPPKPLPSTNSFIETWEGYATGDQNPTPWISKNEINDGWDISTVLFKNTLAIPPAGDLFGSAISSDGTNFYGVGERTSKTLKQYSLTTPYDLSTAVFLQSKVITGQAFPQTGGVVFKPDGTKFFITFSGSDTAHQWTLSTPWDISTAVEGISKCVRTPPNPCNGDGSQGTTGIAFSPDGINMYIGNFILPADQLTQWVLSTPWDVSTATLVRVRSLPPDDVAPQRIFFRPDGTKMFIMFGSASIIIIPSRIDEYILSTPWDISTATWNQIYFDPSLGSFGAGLTFSLDGLKMYTNNISNAFEYDLAPAGVVPIIDIHEVSTSAPIEGLKAFKIHQKYNRTVGFPFGKVSVSRFIPATVRTDGSGLDIPVSFSARMRASILSSFSSPVGAMVGYEFISGAPIGVGSYVETSERAILFKLYGTAGASKVFIWNGTEWVHNNTLDIPISLSTPANTVAEIANVNLKDTLDNSATLSNIYGIDFESHVTGMWIGYVGLNRSILSGDTEVLINGDITAMLNDRTRLKTFSIGAKTKVPKLKTFTVNTILIKEKTFTINALIPPIPATFEVSARVVRRTAVNNAYADAILFGTVAIITQTETFFIDAQIQQPLYKTPTIDAKVIRRKEKTFLIDMIITPKREKTMKIDALVGMFEPQLILTVESVIGHEV